MKRIKFLKALLSFSLVLCLSACVPSKANFSPEETHRYCTAYADEIKCFAQFYHGVEYHSLERFVRLCHRDPPYNVLLCTLQVKSAKYLGSLGGLHTIRLELEITDVHLGYSSVTGKTFTMDVTQDTDDPSPLIGKKYVSFLEGDADLIYSPWLFFLTDYNTLVSPFGCQLEESQIGEDGLSMECRDYTGQTLSYFISKVRELQAKVREES